jgi:cell division transport system permease protein
MLGIFGIIIISGNKLSDYVKEKFKLEVFMKSDMPEGDILRLQKSLEMETWAKKVTYISADEAAKQFTTEVGHDFVGFIGYNPLLPSLEVYLKSDFANQEHAVEIEKILKQKVGVNDVTYSRDYIARVNDNLSKISLIILIISGVFFIISITLINNTIRLNLYARRFLIKSMQLVGATQWFIIRPFMLRSILHGVYGALIAALLLGSMLYGLTQKYQEIIAFYDYSRFALLFVGILSLGVIISMLSSLIATKRYLRLKLDDLY